MFFSTTLSLTCLKSSFVFMVLLAWWCPLLSGVTNSEQVYIYWDHVTLKLHTGGLYLSNYVTYEGNWLHQILFRGFIAKGVNTSVHTTFQLVFFPNFLKQVIFFISLHQFGLFCVCPLHEIQIEIYLNYRLYCNKIGKMTRGWILLQGTVVYSHKILMMLHWLNDNKYKIFWSLKAQCSQKRYCCVF